MSNGAPLLSVGDIAPNFVLTGNDGKEWNLLSDAVAGRPIVIVFCPRIPLADREILNCYARHSEGITAQGGLLFAVSLNEVDPVPSEINFPVLTDRRDKVFKSFGASREHPSTVVLRRNYHVAGIFKGEAEDQVARAVALIQSLEWERKPTLMPVHPPVLLIPEAFSREDCAGLIDIFHKKGQVFFDPQPAMDLNKGADYKMRIPEHMREDRIDHFFFENSTLEFLRKRLTRITPEIAKAFHYRITKYETLRVACYQGHRGGFSHGHRDNIPPFLWRRFAMSINLNTEDFEGGELRFPEFGDQRYRPETGTAIVFSSSLLHEAMHVTAGRRFVFLAFLFGET